MLVGLGENNFFLHYIYKSQEVLMILEVLWDEWGFFFNQVEESCRFPSGTQILQDSLQFYSMLYTFFVHMHGTAHSFSTKSEARLFAIIWRLAPYL